MSRLPIATLLLLAAGPLAAQQPPKPVDLGAELDEIINTDQIQAASKKVQDAASAPADVVVLRSGELRALGYRTLGDALAGVTGFRTNEDRAYQGIAVRGLYVLGDQNTRILVLLDGHALNSPAEVGSSKVGEDLGLPMELVDRIEIVRGPASSLYGNNAFQALVNVVTVDAADSRHTPLQGALTAGDGGRLEAWVNGGASLKGVGLSLTATGFRRTGSELLLPDLQETPLPKAVDREDRQSAYLRARGSDWSASAFLLSRTQRTALAPYYHVPGDPRSLYRNRILSGEFRWEPRTGPVRWMLRAFGDRNEFTGAYVQGPAGDGGVLMAWDRDPDRSLGLELQGRMPLGARVSLTFGTEQRFHRYAGAAPTESEEGLSTVRQDVAYRIGNTYLETHWEPAEGWTLVAGLQGAEWRPSSIRFTYDGVSQEVERQDIQRLTPRLSVIWRAGSRDTVKLVYGEGFRFPTIFERYYTDGPPEIQTYRPNTGLAPEVIRSQQALWFRKWSPGLRTQVSAAFFRWEKQIQAVRLAPELPDGPELQQYQNASSPIQGRALEADLTWRRGGTDLAVGLGEYRWTRDGVGLDNVSRWNAVLKVVQRWGAWSLAGEGRFVGGRDVAAPGAGVPGAWTFRASLRVEAGKLWLQLTGEDLADQRRRDLVAREYEPVLWGEGEGARACLTVGARF